MNFLFDDVVARSRAVTGVAVLSMMVSCAGPRKVALEGPEVFELSKSEQRARFPKVHNIGVVELSGARLTERPFEGGTDREYVASGVAGALLVKKVEPPILAYGAEITVTPDLAMVSGKGVVKQGDRLFIGDSETSRILIDGVMVTAEGPHHVQTVAAWKKDRAAATAAVQLAAVAPEIEDSKPVPTPESEAPAAPRATPKPKKEIAAAKPKKESPRVFESTAPVVSAPKKTPAAPVKKTVPEARKKVTPPAMAKVAPKTTPAPVAKPAADRSQLLNLMREPKE